MPFARRACCAAVASGLAAVAACAQSAKPAAFVANNGNLEGSVTSFTFDADGRPQFVQKVILGTRPNSQTYHPGTNAYAIDISPDGRYLLTSHTTSSTTVEQLSVIEVFPDATMALRTTPTTPDSPLDLAWLNDTHVVVTRTNLSADNAVIVYEFDREALTLTEIDRESGGTFMSYLCVHPSRQFVYASNSIGSYWIRAYRVEPDSRLTQIQEVVTTPSYPLGLEVTPDGTRLYAGGGASGTRTEMHGFFVGPDGMLTSIPGTPFATTGNSPFNFSFSEDSAIMFVGHGTDATVRSFLLDSQTGVPAYSGFMFDVGLQGSFGDSAVLGDLLLVTDDTSATDGTTGLYSFTIHPTGEFTANGPIASTGATAPTDIAVWTPPTNPCPEDISGDGMINLTDLAMLLVDFGSPTAAPGDIDADGDVDLSDLAMLLSRFGVAC